MPIFIRKGTAMMHGEWNSNQDKATESVMMKIYASETDENYRFTFYDDDGETFDYEAGDFLRLDLEIQSSADTIDIRVIDKEGKYKPRYNKITIDVIGLEKQVIVNGEKTSVINL